MKKYIFVVLTALLVVSCENTESSRGKLTQRGNSIYREWNVDMQILNRFVNFHTFELNKMLNAETETEADSIYNNYFQQSGYELETLDENVYFMKSNCGYGYNGHVYVNSFMILTDGKDLTLPGAEWNIVFNIPQDFEYHKKSMQKMSPIEPVPVELAYGSEFVIFAVACVASDTWTWKGNTSENSFSVDLTVKKVAHEVVPGLVAETRYAFNGNGLFLIDSKKHYISYEMQDVEIQKKQYDNQFCSGDLQLVAKNGKTGEEIPVSVTFNKKNYSVTYKGITEEYDPNY